jgi:S1-C subfamily serine protease
MVSRPVGAALRAVLRRLPLAPLRRLRLHPAASGPARVRTPAGVRLAHLGEQRANPQPTTLRKCAASCKKPFAVRAGSCPKAEQDSAVRVAADHQVAGRTTVESSREGNMYADAVAKITESIFPIFYIQPQGDLVGVCGTGFFVGKNGLFVTADHIMAAVPTGSRMYYYGKAPDEICEPAVEIEHLASDPAQDLYLGRVSREYLPPVEVSNEAVRPGDSVCLSGYPMAVLAISPEGGLVGNVRRYWQPTFVIDATQAVVDGRTYDGYIVQDPCLAGMSGGPVFDIEGKVRGMAAANLTRTIPEPGGAPTIVRNGIVSDGAHIRRFLEDTAVDRREPKARHQAADGCLHPFQESNELVCTFSPGANSSAVPQGKRSSHDR